MEAVVLQAVRGQPLGGRSRTRAPEGARRRKAHVVEQNDEHVRRARRWVQRLNRRKRRRGILGVERGIALVRAIRYRQDVTRDLISHARLLSALSERIGLLLAGALSWS